MSEDKGGAACGARLLRIHVSENRALIRDAVDVWGLVAHHPAAIGTDVPETNVIAPDNDDIGLFLSCLCGRLSYPGYGNSCNHKKERKESHPTPPFSSGIAALTQGSTVLHFSTSSNWPFVCTFRLRLTDDN